MCWPGLRLQEWSLLSRASKVSEAAGAGVVVAAVEAAALSFFDFDFEVEGVVEELAVELAGVVAAAAFDFLPLVDLDVEVVDEDELAGAVA